MAAVRGVKKKDHENLTEANIEKVIGLLNQDTPITKKEACAILNIAYNTARLARIIEEYEGEKEFQLRKRKEMRTKPISDNDRQYMIQAALEGEALSEISKATFRSVNVVKNVLYQAGLPNRESSVTYSKPAFLPDHAIREQYTKGDLVFSARYNSAAEVERLAQGHPEHGPVYRIWVFATHQYANQPYYELGDLTEVQKKYNIKVEDYHPEDIQRLIAEGILAARKKTK